MRFIIIRPDRLPVCFNCDGLTISELALIIWVWMLCWVGMVVHALLEGGAS